MQKPEPSGRRNLQALKPNRFAIMKTTESRHNFSLKQIIFSICNDIEKRFP